MEIRSVERDPEDPDTLHVEMAGAGGRLRFKLTRQSNPAMFRFLTEHGAG